VVRKPDRFFMRKCGLASVEGRSHRAGENVADERVLSREEPEVVVVLHAAVPEPQLHHRVKLLGDRRFRAYALSLGGGKSRSTGSTVDGGSGVVASPNPTSTCTGIFAVPS